MNCLIEQCKGGMAMTARNVPKVMSGDKTQTRRIIKGLSLETITHCERMSGDKVGFHFWKRCMRGPFRSDSKYPNHRVGDILYIKEALRKKNPGGQWSEYQATYAVDGAWVPMNGIRRPWKRMTVTPHQPYKRDVLPSRFMPKSAARTFIRITDVRCERIQDISEDDCQAEGCMFQGTMSGTDSIDLSYRGAFRDLWDSTNGQGAWERNDWVFAYSFELVKE